MASAMKSKGSKLDKMAMPSKKKPMDDAMLLELEMEPAGDEASDDMANEMEGEADAESDAEMPPEDNPLADISDDDLMAEMKRRGLSADAEMEMGSESDEK